MPLRRPHLTVSHEARSMGRLLGVYGALGVIAGSFAIAFAWGVDQLSGALVPHLPPMLDGWPTWHHLAVLVLPALGGLVVGGLARFAPEVMGSGIDHVVDTYLRHRGAMRRRVPWIKGLASVATLSTGGSAGIEGPVGQISAALGSWLGPRFRLSAAERRGLVMAGFAAGIGAVFQAPMAAAIFAAEVLYSDMDIEHEVLVPAIIASTVAHGLFKVAGAPHLFVVPSVRFDSGLELLPYTALGVALSAAAVLFVLGYRRLRTRLRGSTVPRWLRPALGGLGVGVVGVVFPAVLGRGYGIIELALSPLTPALLLLGLAIAKAGATIFTVGSGGAGGLFAPSLVIGGALGGLIGRAAAELLPGLAIEPTGFVVVGMAGFFAAVSNAPLSTVIMVSELSGSYALVVPALWVCTLSWLLARKLSLFDAQVATRVDAPFRLADMMGAVLHRMTVREALGDPPPAPTTVPPNLPLRELVARFAHSPQAVFPILDGAGRLQGVVDGRLLRRTLAEQGVDTLLIANDFQGPAVTVPAGASLHDAITAMSNTGFDELPVVETDGRLVGILSRRQVVNAYHRRMLDRAPGDGTPAPEGYPSDEQTLSVDLAAAVARGGVLPDVAAQSPDGVMAELVARADLAAGCDRGELLSLLRAREALMSTGVGDGIALPHPHAEHLTGVDAPRVIIGLLREPVAWAAPDGQPVDTVCVLLCPSGDVHLELLGALARALHDPTLRALLRAHAPSAEILARISALEPAHAP